MAAKKFLTQDKLFTVYDWLRANQDLLLKERPTRRAVAEKIEKSLGFPVSLSTISQCFDHLGINYNPTPTFSGQAPRTVHRARMSSLIAAVVELYGHLNRPLPGHLKEVIEADAQTQAKAQEKNGQVRVFEH